MPGAAEFSCFPFLEQESSFLGRLQSVAFYQLFSVLSLPLFFKENFRIRIAAEPRSPIPGVAGEPDDSLELSFPAAAPTPQEGLAGHIRERERVGLDRKWLPLANIKTRHHSTILMLEIMAMK